MILYEALEKDSVLADAETWGQLRAYFVNQNECTQDYCPNITGIRLHIGDEQTDLPQPLVRDFINELCCETKFITWVDEDTKRFDREAV
jgi:hypothetical protein